MSIVIEDELDIDKDGLGEDEKRNPAQAAIAESIEVSIVEVWDVVEHSNPAQRLAASARRGEHAAVGSLDERMNSLGVGDGHQVDEEDEQVLVQHEEHQEDVEHQW